MDRLHTIQYPVQVEPVFTGAETVSIDKWLEPLAEPVRFRRIKTAAMAPSLAWGWTQFVETTLPSKWFAPLSEPKRFNTRLRPALQQFYIADPLAQVGIDKLMSRWFEPFSEPKRFKKRIEPSEQRFFEMPPRVIPTPSVFAVLDAFEINGDEFLGAVNVYESSGTTTAGTGARVSIVEVRVGGDPVSIREH